jgi:hypothetical protein
VENTEEWEEGKIHKGQCLFHLVINKCNADIATFCKMLDFECVKEHTVFRHVRKIVKSDY